MLTYIFRRTLLALIALTGVVVITFVLTRVIPADPAATWMGPRATADQIAQARVELGLDDPLPLQFGNYIRSFLQGDWGVSLVTKRPVLWDLAAVVPATVELLIFGLSFGFIVGMPLGVLSAARANRGLDHTSRLISIAGVALPSFWFAMMLQLVFGASLGVLPLTGRISHIVRLTSPIDQLTGFLVIDSLVQGNFRALADSLRHVVLPAVALAAYPLGLATRMVRSTMLEILSHDYIRTARASGIAERRVLGVYALRNAVGSVLTVWALTFGYALVSSFLIETIFAWPGLGRYAAQAIVSVDYPAIMGVTVLVAATYTLLNLTVDLLQAALDPRIRLE